MRLKRLHGRLGRLGAAHQSRVARLGDAQRTALGQQVALALARRLTSGGL